MTIKAYNITYNLSVAVLSQNNIKEVNNAFYHLLMLSLGFPGGSVNKESTCNAGYLGSVPGLGRNPGGGHGNPLQHSCLENPVDIGAWRATAGHD